MFFGKTKKTDIQIPAVEENPVVVTENEVNDVDDVNESNDVNVQETQVKQDIDTEFNAGKSYAFYKPDPYPKELVSVIKGMLQRLFPDTKRAYILEAQKNEQKGYLVIVDIDSQFLKMINIYLDGETKKVRGDIPIECILYSKSGSLTEGIDPFYFKENAQSKANNLASKEFSSDVVFSQMPEFELWKSSGKSAPVNTEETKKETVNTQEQQSSDLKEKQPEITGPEVKPATKKELFGIINEYGEKTGDEISAVAVTAVKEYEFYIPYTIGKDSATDTVDTSLPIDEKLRFRKLINPDNELSAVPLFTEKEEALKFAQKCNCRTVCLKYKDFASSRAAELTRFDGVLINPDSEGIFLLLTHPLLG